MDTIVTRDSFQIEERKISFDKPFSWVKLEVYRLIDNHFLKLGLAHKLAIQRNMLLENEIFDGKVSSEGMIIYRCVKDGYELKDEQVGLIPASELILPDYSKRLSINFQSDYERLNKDVYNDKINCKNLVDFVNSFNLPQIGVELLPKFSESDSKNVVEILYSKEHKINVVY